MTNKIMHGVVNGKTIELTEDPGVPAGQEVEVLVTPVPATQLGWGEGLGRRAATMCRRFGR